ncbi:hypothetical protein OQA88_9909 [Cercophora sp. LCS_1]
MLGLLDVSPEAAGLPDLHLASAAFASHSRSRNGTGFRGNRPVSSNRTVVSSGPSSFRVTQMEDYGPQVNFTIWLLTALSAAFLALRVYCKFLRHRGLWWDDHVLIAAWLSLALSNSFVSVAISLGFGRPLSQFNFDRDLDVFLLMSNLAGTFSILAACWSKTSFAITVLRISSGWMKGLVWVIIITVNLSLGVAVAITWGQCTPIEKIWQPLLDGECWPKYVQIRYNTFTAVYSGAMDIVLAVVPWKMIWTLTMNKKEKFGVLVAMSMGIFAGVTSIIKLTQLPTISNTSFTDSSVQLVILAAAEGAITIIAASIPILRALLRDTRPPPGPAQFYHSFNDSMYAGTENSRGTGRSSTVITSGNRSTSRMSKEYRPGHLRQLSKLSHFSGISMGFSNHSRRNSDSDFDLPPGKIIQTEEVSVEWESNPGSNQQWAAIGNAI